jgi:hypothetical protein
MSNPFPDAIISYTVKPAPDRLVDLGTIDRPEGMPQIIPEGWLLSDIEKSVGKRDYFEYGDGLLTEKRVRIPISEIRAAAAMNPTGRVYITLHYKIPELENIPNAEDRERLFFKRMAEAGRKPETGVRRRNRKDK